MGSRTIRISPASHTAAHTKCLVPREGGLSLRASLETGMLIAQACCLLGIQLDCVLRTTMNEHKITGAGSFSARIKAPEKEIASPSRPTNGAKVLL
jgi:hypothetical protein